MQVAAFTCTPMPPLLVDGTLIVNGEKAGEVLFTGDRLDDYYRDLPSSWPGIYFRATSQSNLLRFAVLKMHTRPLFVSIHRITASPN